MDSHEKSSRKQAIISATWEYLLKTGLANASIGELCKQTGISQSSLYYWFENKDDIWIVTGRYGLSKVVDALFTYTLEHTRDVRKYFDNLLSEVEKYKHELRLALQITTNPVFGERMREKSKEFRALYESFGEKIVGIFGCSPDQAEYFIYSIIVAVIDYAIWDDGEKTQMLLENLYVRILEKINIDIE